ncbi:hypothetical protein GOP47_0030779, partial [Adiantum capillus-veneris]
NFITLDVHEIHGAKAQPESQLNPPKPIYMRTNTLPNPRHSLAGYLPQLKAHSASFRCGRHGDMSTSFSKNSSPWSAEGHAQQNAMMSKLRWGSLINHKLRAVWRKVCSTSCPQYG